MQGEAEGRRDLGLKAIHLSASRQAVARGGADPAESLGNAPAMRVHGEDLTIKRIHHYATGDLDADARKRNQERFAFRVRHLPQRGERWIAERCDDEADRALDETRFGVVEPANVQALRQCALVGTGYGSEGREGAAEIKVSTLVVGLGGLRAADDKQELIERVPAVPMGVVTISAPQ